MKLVRYGADGREKPGLIDVEGKLRDLSGHIQDLTPDHLNDTALAKLARIKTGNLPLVRGKPRMGCPISQVGKFIAIGLNYADHVVETNREKTEDPALFIRFANSQMGHLQPMLVPPESSHLDYEGEIAIVIGKGGRRIPEARAYEHVAGFSCYNDGSVRDLQWATTQWTTGKNFPATGAFGPWLTTTDDVPADTRLTLITRLNGQEMQRATTDMMIHSIPRLIAFISVFTELVPGDVIVTGTPGGVGARKKPPLFMKDGDVCEIEIERVGVLRTPIQNERL